MRSGHANLFFHTDGGWRLAWPGLDASVAVDAEAGAVGAALDGSGRARRVILALPSAWCLSAAVSLDGLPKRGRAAALRYRLEEKLPIAAEDVVADFVLGDAEAFGIAVETSRLAPLVAALEAEGVVVTHACPAALLALGATSPGDADVVLWRHGEEVEAILMHAGRPAGWLTLPADAGELPPQVRMATADLGREPRLITHDVNPELLGPLRAGESDEADFAAAAVECAAQIAAGRAVPPVDLLRALPGRAGATLRRLRTPLTAALSAAVVFLLVASAGLLWRADRYERIAADAAAAQVRAFELAFPGERVPLAANVRRRLETAANAGPTVAARPESALALLGRVIGRLPEGRRFQVLELRVSDGELLLEGEAQTLADADAVATALRGLEAFDIEPPATEQLGPGRVAFRVVGGGVRPVADGRASR